MYVGLLLFAAGIFSICGAAFDWDWFMDDHRARPFVWILGRDGARAFYGLIGSALAVFGALVAIGVVPLSK